MAYCSLCTDAVDETRYRYCRACGNDMKMPVDPELAGIIHLQRAYRLVDGRERDPTAADYQESRECFEKALAFERSFPPTIRLVAWFEYAMRMIQVFGGGPLKRIPTKDLRSFTYALDQADQLLRGLPDVVRREIQVVDPYAHMIRSNSNEAMRVFAARGEV